MPTLTSIKNQLQQNFRNTVLFFVIFYSVGIGGMLIPFTFPLFVKLIPLALLLSSVTLAFFHGMFNTKTVLVFLSIYFLGFFIEVVGVNTGAIFGEYSYSNGLGIKLFNTPLIIGLNWLMLIYITSAVLESVKMHPLLKILLAAVMMMGYDIIIEQVAPTLHMWEFQNNEIPFQNYVAWYFVAVLFHTLIKVFSINTKNWLAGVILLCQLIFFLILLIAFKLAN